MCLRQRADATPDCPPTSPRPRPRTFDPLLHTYCDSDRDPRNFSTPKPRRCDSDRETVTTPRHAYCYADRDANRLPLGRLDGLPD